MQAGCCVPIHIGPMLLADIASAYIEWWIHQQHENAPAPSMVMTKHALMRTNWKLSGRMQMHAYYVLSSNQIPSGNAAAGCQDQHHACTCMAFQLLWPMHMLARQRSVLLPLWHQQLHYLISFKESTMHALAVFLKASNAHEDMLGHMSNITMEGAGAAFHAVYVLIKFV